MLMLRGYHRVRQKSSSLRIASALPLRRPTGSAGEHPAADDVHPAQGEMLMAGCASSLVVIANDDATKSICLKE